MYLTAKFVARLLLAGICLILIGWQWHTMDTSETVKITFLHSVADTAVNINPSVVLNKSADWSLYPPHTLPVTANCSWVQDLYRITRLTGPQITLLMCNEKYLAVLINWLAYTAKREFLTVKDTVILSRDYITHKTFMHKGFQSVFVPIHAIIQPGSKIKDLKAGWITRITAIHVLNSWNFNVLVIDGDAMILKDMRPLFEQFKTADIVAAPDIYPRQLYDMWKTTLCMGVALFKGTKAIEYFWHTVKEKVNYYDDQIAINYAFLYMGITWRTLSTEAWEYFHGTTNGSVPLEVVMLPNSVLCRICKKALLDTYYNWHPLSYKNVQSKMSRGMQANTWVLQENWNTTLLNNVTGTEWLLSIITD